jgi:hypothetical protein
MKKLATLIMLLILFSGYAKAETEPNDTWDLANTVLLGQTETGTAGLAQEQDWWTVSIPDDGTLTLNWTSLNGNLVYCQIYDTLGVLQFASNYTGSSPTLLMQRELLPDITILNFIPIILLNSPAIVSPPRLLLPACPMIPQQTTCTLRRPYWP